jgi:hypothetical protein
MRGLAALHHEWTFVSFSFQAWILFFVIVGWLNGSEY